MAVDREKMRKDREKKSTERGVGNWWRPQKPGEYLLYICPPFRDDLDFPYIEHFEHFKVGSEEKKVTCLDEKNEILTDDRVHKFVTGGPEATEGGCPICEELEDARESIKKERGRRRSFLFNVVVIGTRRDSRDDWEEPEDGGKVQTFAAGATVWEGITDVILAEGDITDPKAAIFVRLTRKGTGQNDTRYTVAADGASLRKPVVLSKAIRSAMADAMAPGGDADLFRVIGSSVRSRQKIEDLMEGVEIEDDDDDAPPARNSRGSRSGRDSGRDSERDSERRPPKEPKCFKMDYADDDECARCPVRGPCSTHLKIDLHEGHELKEGDVGYEPPRRGRREEEPARARREEPARGRRSSREDDDEEPPRRRTPAREEEPPRRRAAVEEEETPRRRSSRDDDEEPAPRSAGRRAAAKDDEGEEPASRRDRETETRSTVSGRTVTRDVPPKKDPEPPAEDEDDDEKKLKGLGLDSRQILRIDDEGKALVIRHKLRGDWISVLKSGKVVVIEEKLPDGHPLKEADDDSDEPPPTKKPEPDPEPPPRRRAAKTDEEEPPPRRRGAGKASTTDEEPPARTGRAGASTKPPEAAEDDAPGGDDDDAPAAGGEDLDLDQLERDLSASAKPQKGKKK